MLLKTSTLLLLKSRIKSNATIPLIVIRIAYTLTLKNNDKVNIGDKLLVQVVNDAHKTKPPTASCKIELTGKYVVLSSDVNRVAVSKK